MKPCFEASVLALANANKLHSYIAFVHNSDTAANNTYSIELTKSAGSGVFDATDAMYAGLLATARTCPWSGF